MGAAEFLRTVLLLGTLLELFMITVVCGLVTGIERSSTALTAVLMAKLVGVGTRSCAAVTMALEGVGEAEAMRMELSVAEGAMVAALSASMGEPGAELPSRACGVRAEVASAACGKVALLAQAAATGGVLHFRQGRSSDVSTMTSPLGPLKIIPQQTSVLCRKKDQEKISSIHLRKKYPNTEPHFRSSLQ